VVEGVALAGASGEAVSGARAQRRCVDEATFTALYERNGGRLRGYLRRICRDPGAADDLLQETFLRFYRSRLELRGERETCAYLFRIATNLATDHWRRSARARQALQGEAARLPSSTETPGDPGWEERWIRRQEVERAFARLAVRERAMIWLAYVEGCDHAEIAERIGSGRASVRVLLFRARRKLARLLREGGVAPEGRS
jgi:RNA polymerase sigma-70 factor (ECF subfamily)